MAGLTFSQAQGFGPIPPQSSIGTVSQATTAALWKVVYEALENAGNGSFLFRKTAIFSILRGWWVEIYQGMIDEAPESYFEWQNRLRVVFDAGFPHSYDLAQYILDYEGWSSLDEEIASALDATRAAYRVVSGKIVPFGSAEELTQLRAAIATAEAAGAKGSRAHLLQAGSELTRGAWTQAVQECIAAVEGAARFVTGEHTMTLGAILARMRKDGKFNHPALADALSKLYGYTSDAQGIRHSLVLSDNSAVTEREAFLMFGLCASFVTYLLSL